MVFGFADIADTSATSIEGNNLEKPAPRRKLRGDPVESVPVPESFDESEIETDVDDSKEDESADEEEMSVDEESEISDENSENEEQNEGLALLLKSFDPDVVIFQIRLFVLKEILHRKGRGNKKATVLMLSVNRHCR